jgi:hypothetical protein
MRFVHSLYTRPIFTERNNIEPMHNILCTIWNYAVSVSCLKKLGQEIVLYTDDLGYKMLNFLPYDEIHLTLNEIPHEYDMMWACGKFYAMQNEPLSSIHIDGDVFIFNEHCLDKFQSFQNGGSDLLVQDIEPNPSYVYDIYLKNFISIPEDLLLLNKNIPNNSCNVGVICFNNQSLKDEYYSLYFSILEKVHNSNIRDYYNNNKKLILDLIPEQYFLWKICENKYKIQTLIDFHYRNESHQTEGYHHNIGRDKFDKHLNSVLQKRFSKFDKEMYNITLNFLKDFSL